MSRQEKTKDFFFPYVPIDTNCELVDSFVKDILIKDEKVFKKNKTPKALRKDHDGILLVPKNSKTLDEWMGKMNEMVFSDPNGKDICIPSNIIRFLNEKLDSQDRDNKYFIIPWFAEKCYQKKGVAFWLSSTPESSLLKNENWYNCFKESLKNNHNQINFEPPLYICKNWFYTEYIISLMVSDFYTSNKSIHFVPVEPNSFSTCLKNEKPLRRRQRRKDPTPHISIHEFFSMTRVKGHPLSKPKQNVSPLSNKGDYQNACLIQVLHSIAVYQNQLISHNDLHGANILIEQILYSTRWNNQDLIDYDYFQYKFEDKKSLYIPFVPFLIKIIDFGLSCKYGKGAENAPFSPVVLNNLIMTNKVGEPGPSVNRASLIPPNWYFAAYDILLFLFIFCIYLFPENLLGQQILWVALHFSEIDEKEWSFEKEIDEETDAKQFYSKYNEMWVKCIKDVNDELTPYYQITLAPNIINRYKDLNSSSLLKKCMNNSSILKSYTQAPDNDKKCIILGTTDFLKQTSTYHLS